MMASTYFPILFRSVINVFMCRMLRILVAVSLANKIRGIFTNFIIMTVVDNLNFSYFLDKGYF